MKIMSANRIAPDGTPCIAASHLGLFCLPMSHKKDARRICVNSGYKVTLHAQIRSSPVVLRLSLRDESLFKQK